VGRARRDEEQLVLIRGEGLNELLDVERSRAADGVMGQPFEFTEVAITAKAKYTRLPGSLTMM
jgi:hypothetical protein